MGYQSINIENFRGISKLEISDLKQVNLIVGRNNCGKTSVLEAVFLLSGMSNPQLSVGIHAFRDLILLSDEELGLMFRNLNFDNQIFISGSFEEKKRDLKIAPIFRDFNPKNTDKINQKSIDSTKANYPMSTEFDRQIEGLRYDFHDNNDKLFSGQIRVSENKFSIPNNYKEFISCSWLNQYTIMREIDKRIDKLLVNKKLGPIIKILKQIEPKITDIRLGTNNLVYVDIGKEQLMPLNIMGDGMRRILSMLATIEVMKNGVVLIDEIENGFHYSSIEIAWKAILAACRVYNVQLIATTHSYGCIEALSNEYEKFESEGDDIRLFRLDKDGDEHKAYAASAKVLKAGLEKDFEVR